MDTNRLNHLDTIVIVGGGTAGWIAASALSHELRNIGTNIVLVESDDIGTVGVGEAVIPPFLNFIRGIGIDEKDFIQHTQGTFKLGIEFKNWKSLNHSYFHHFGALGATIGGHDFYHCWLRSRRSGLDYDLMDFSPAAVMAKHHKFMLPFMMGGESPLSGMGYALHFDASLVAKYLRGYSEKRGVVRKEGIVNQVCLDADGRIEKLYLASGEMIRGDFFIDCSGFRGLLIEGSMSVEYETWRDYLPCDRAVAVQTEGIGEIPPYTISAAKESGWTWRIPLQHRTGNGYVYCSDYCGEDEAISTLLAGLDGAPISEPKVIPFKTGVRKSVWNGNCLSLGLSSGFLEPLESTAIHLVIRGIQNFIRLIPTKDSGHLVVEEYNTRMAEEYQEIRDFIILHYCTTQRDDTPFWQYCASMPIPDSLRDKIELFRCRGIIRNGLDDLFKVPSWYAVFNGMGIVPEEYYPMVDAVDREQLLAAMREGKRLIQSMVEALPDHAEFIKANCPAGH